MVDKTKRQMKEEWLQALRSGKYAQVKGTLKGVTEDGEEGYCCLGVFASVVLGEEPPLCVPDEDGELDEGPQSTYSKIEGICPQVQMSGIEMNDGGKSFSIIADMIEKEWKV